jgi:hypothetical protein
MDIRFKKFLKNISKIFIGVIIGIISLEICSFYLTINYKFLVSDYPVYYERRNLSESKWRTEEEEWGAWHKKNSSGRHVFPCFNVTYKSNEVGARDESFATIKNASNYILLGDSFAEGYGVGDQDLSKTYIQQALNKRVLNFGAAGSVGPLQYYLIYEKLAKKYPHDGLIIYLLPENDFTDNDYKDWKHVVAADGSERFRPYYQPVGDKFTYFYPINAKKHDSFIMSPFLSNIVEYFWFGNAIKTISIVSKRWKIAAEEKNKQLENKQIENLNNPKNKTKNDEILRAIYDRGYFTKNQEQQKAAIFFLEEIIKNSPARDIVLVAIPSKNDIRYINETNDVGYRETYWWKGLQKIKAESHGRIIFIDLAEYLPPTTDHLFLSCDSHWSPEGNKWAGNIIAAEILKKELNLIPKGN